MKKITTLLTALMLPVLGFSQTAKVQIIHNSGDELLKRIDVYQNTTLIGDSLAFRSATPFVDVPANAPVVFTVQSPTLPDTSNALHHDTLMLDADSSYVLITSGIVSNSSFYDSLKPFKLALHRARSQALSAGNVDVLFYNGATESPELNIDERVVPLPMLVDSLPYGQFSPYRNLASADYIFDVFDARTTDLIATYAAPFSTLGLSDSAIVVVASGFIDTLKSNPGDTSETRVPKFGLYAALPSGGSLIPLPVLSDISLLSHKVPGLSLYPNPASGQLFIKALPGRSGLRVSVVDMAGRETLNISPPEISAGLYQLSTSTLKPGVYLVRIKDSDGMLSVQQIAIKR